MTPSKAGQAFVARSVSALGQCPKALALLAVVVALVMATVSIRRINIDTSFRLPSPLAITDPSTDPSMTVISTMVERGDLWGATARVGSSYRFDKPAGLLALRRFSVLVLRRGLQEYDPYERCYAMSALAAAGDRDEIAQLVKIFQRTRKPGLKMAVADGLGDVGDADAVEALGRLYSLDRAFIPANRGQWSGGGPRSRRNRIAEPLPNRSDRATRLTAEKGLGQLGNREAVRILRQFSGCHAGSLRKATAAYSLLRLGDRSAAEIAESILRGHVDDNARAMAAVALGRASDPRVVGLLREAISDHNIDVRIGAAVALTHYGDPVGAEYLKAAMQDEDSMTRLHVGQLLDEVEFRNAREVLMAAVASPDPELSLRGIRAIGLSGGADEVGFLVRLADTAGGSDRSRRSGVGFRQNRHSWLGRAAHRDGVGA